MIICKRLVHPDDHLQEASPSLVVVCRWLWFVIGRCLPLVIVCCLLLFVVVIVCGWSLFVVGRCLSLVLFVVCCCLLSVVICRYRYHMNLSIESVDVVKNRYLQKQFDKKKRELNKTEGSEVKSLLLFHGTPRRTSRSSATTSTWARG